MTQRKPHERRFVLDSTPNSCVVRCTLCEWRGFSHSKPVARRQVAEHLSYIHGEHKAAADIRAADIRAALRKVEGAVSGSPA